MYGHDMHEGEWNRQQDKLINQLEKGINGEADRTIRKAFRRAAADEQNHAVSFLFYLVKRRS
ncbi:hypothetical protein Q5O89_22410 [Peribacillus frigoritolerans]|nr:hypothetical protein [Peribacillus frigoritolerans]